MKIALPIVQNQLCMHFGHCESFAFFEVDADEKKIINKTTLSPPPHEPGILPPWIKSHGAGVVITGGIGVRAQNLFQANGIKVVTGASGNPDQIVLDYLNDSLQTGVNACDH